MGIFSKCKTTTDQGNIGLVKAIYELQVIGYRVSKPITENQDYDLIVDKNSKLERVQVKTTKQKSKYGVFMANLRTMGGNQSFNTVKKRKKGDYELLYVLTDNDDSYLIPDEDFEAINTISLGKDKEKYKIKL